MVIVGLIIELVALIAIMRLWYHRPFKAVSNALWSIVLLVPFFGLIIYLFLRDDPPSHGERVRPYTGEPGP